MILKSFLSKDALGNPFWKVRRLFMHEMTIAQNLIEIIKDEMIRHDAKTLKSVLLHVGQLTTIVPESLSFCFEVMTSGTEMEGAELIIDIIPLKGMCRECEKTFEIRDYAFECPH